MSSKQEAPSVCGPRERIYNERMDGLVDQLRELSMEHGIPLIIMVELDKDTAGDRGHLTITSTTSMQHAERREMKMLGSLIHGRGVLIPVKLDNEGRLHAPNCACEDKSTPPKGQCN